MNKKLIRIIIISILIGLIITLITGLFLNLEETYLGSSRWGYPIYWLSQMIVGPQYSPPLNIVWLNLVIDILVWSVLVFLILVIVFREEKIK